MQCQKTGKVVGKFTHALQRQQKKIRRYKEKQCTYNAVPEISLIKHQQMFAQLLSDFAQSVSSPPSSHFLLFHPF